ncbi:MAG: DNA polymerase bacteriophage-type [Parcubacteria group bacterium Gr01-1014_38]|nr:MAG: DNA polymerase bacteriophage-type [Parcubacteria group bacterium Gr01-1014_38]
MTRDEKARELQKIADEVELCQLCPLYKTGTRGVPGEGNPEAEILFIGEGPGQKEDELGRPFVGPAGQLLEELLRHVGLTRSDVYIANVIKHRPPGNRDPLPDELEACWPYLRRQIEVIQPKVIVLLGRHALERFLPGKSISQVRGKAYRVGGMVYFAMYHPAAALYQGSLRDTLFTDMEKLPAILKQIKQGDGIPELEQPKKPSEAASSEDSTQGQLL